MDPETLERNFGKMKEDFVKNDPIHKNLSHFLHKCHGLEDSNGSLQPIFQI
jgi:hypothetical protein